MVSSANRGKEQVLFGNDSIVIKKYNAGIEGGRTLKTAGYPLTNIFAGHVIVKLADGNYAPMPLKTKVGEDSQPVKDENGNTVYEYDTLPEGASYAGILYRSISVSDPQASIMFDGVVNEACLPYAVTAIKSAFVAAFPNIVFQMDEDCGKTTNA